MALSRREQEQVERLLEKAALEGARAGARATLRRVMASRARELLRADYEAAESIVARLGLTATLSRLADLFLPGSVRRWIEGLRPVIADVAAAATDPKSDALGVSFDVRNPAMADFLDSYTSQLADTLSETTYGQVMDVVRQAQGDGLSVPDASKLLRNKAGIETRRRADLIARNELLRTSKGASYLQAAQSGLVRAKTHRHSHDERVREEHRFEETVPIDEPYSNGEMWSGQLSVSCRCVDIFEVDFEALEA